MPLVLHHLRRRSRPEKISIRPITDPRFEINCQISFESWTRSPPTQRHGHRTLTDLLRLPGRTLGPSAHLESDRKCLRHRQAPHGAHQGRPVAQHGAAHGLQARHERRQKNWRRLKGENQLPRVIAGVNSPTVSPTRRRQTIAPPDRPRHPFPTIALPHHVVDTGTTARGA